MQKLFNVLTAISFGFTSCIVAGGAYVYLNKDALIEKAKEQVFAQMGEALGGQLGSALLSGDADPVKGMDETGAVEIPTLPAVPF